MKKLLIALIPLVFLMCLILTLTPSKASSDELAYWLHGTVFYHTGSKVGPGKPVYVHYSQDQYYGYVPTDNNSNYKWPFYSPFYVYKVRCAFYVGTTYYSGETIIDDTLTADTRVDIIVYPGGAPPDGAGY